MENTCSEYLRKLLLENPDVGERYQMKLKLIGDLDPFTIKNLEYSIDTVPPVTNMDIVAYLVLTHSFYTREQMNAFKSLQAYKYFEAGFVVKAGTKMANDFYILVGKVKHSQKANVKPLDVWCIISKDGSVSTAHCTCMACSHVGAILFAAEYAHTRKETVSCTDVRAMWPLPSLSTQAAVVPVREMNWGKSSIPQEKADIPPITDVELAKLLEDIEGLDHSSALMRVVEPFASKINNEATKTLPSIMDVFNKNNIGKGHSELMALTNTINLSVTQDQTTVIEQSTRNQSENRNWYEQRAGRITASRFKAVCRTNKEKPSLSLIKSICYPTNVLFRTKATSWGITHEQVAVEEYQKIMEEEHHIAFQINEVGLLVNKKWPQLGASPDRLIYCDCCLGGCLEIKCPYTLYTNNVKDINEYLGMKYSCLIKNDSEITLDKKHTYYFQVQMQIFISQLLYCDFVIWSPHIFFKLRILPDPEFWDSNHEIALQFHSRVIMPELLGRFFTRGEGAEKMNHYCICNGVDDGRPMMRCDGGDCDKEWFHFECVGLVHTPDSAWFCSKCKST